MALLTRSICSSGALSDSDIQVIYRAGQPGQTFVGAPGSIPLAVRPGLADWWTADGTTADSIGGNDGALENGAGYAPGIVGQAFRFDGVTNDVRVPYSSNFDINGPFTVEAWVKADPQQLDPSGLFGIVDKSHGFGDSTGWVLQGTTSNGTVSFLVGAGGAGSGNFVGVATQHSVLDNQWHHLVGVYTGAAVEIYLDGVLQGSAAFAGAPAGNTRDLVFGETGVASVRHFHGLIDEVAIYQRAPQRFRDSGYLQRWAKRSIRRRFREGCRDG